MTKIIIGVVGLIAAVVVGFFALNEYIYNEKQAPRGTVNEPTGTAAESMETGQSPQVKPISHATMVLTIAGLTIYNDPVGEKSAFDGEKTPDVILVSDIHGDHLSSETLQAVSTGNTLIIVPQAVADELPSGLPGTVKVLKNGETHAHKGLSITAVPMYNVPESSDARHTKGRGNGYILEGEGKRVYIAGDTGGTPEMRALKNIDVAFVPMNMPFTMSVEDAAEAVLAFKPKVVHPYHYRGQDGLADVNKFKELVNAGDPSITVELLNFYPES